jgi:hypothetical protein
MCPKTVVRDRRVTLQTRWSRARIRLFACQGDYENRLHDDAKVKKHLAAASRWLHQGTRDAGVTELGMKRLEYQLDQLWAADNWKKRYGALRRQLKRHPGAVEAFDGLIHAGCYAGLIVAGVLEIARPIPLRVSRHVRQQARDRAKRLATQFSDLADENAAAVQGWPANAYPVFDRSLTQILRHDAHRLREWVVALDARHQTGQRPHRLTMFLAAVHHAKDVTGTYRDQEFAQILDGLGVKPQVSLDTIRKWRRRVGNAERDDPRRPAVDRLREWI